MSNGYINIPGLGSGGGSWKEPVADFASLPVSGNDSGDARVTLDTSDIYIWDGAAWVLDSAVDANAIYRNDTQPPTQDISWDGFSLYDLLEIQDSTAVPVLNTSSRRLFSSNSALSVDFENRTLSDGLVGDVLIYSGGAPRATTGVLRLQNNDSITWRDSADGADLFIKANSGNAFEFNGIFGGSPNQYATLAQGPYASGSILTLTGSNSKIISGLFTSAARETNDPGLYTAGINLYYGEQISWSGLQLGSIYSGLHLTNSGTAFLWADDSLQVGNYFQHGDAFAAIPSSGAVRLQNNDLINWRNAANSADRGIKLNTSDEFIVGFGSTMRVESLGVNDIHSDSGNPNASIGYIRQPYSSRIAWRNNADSGDVYLNVGGGSHTDSFFTSSEIEHGTLYQYGTATTSGFINLNNSSSISWRNNANSADISMYLGTDDNFHLGSSIILSSYVQMAQHATPANPPASSNKLYFKADDNLYMLDSAGAETQISNASTGANTTLSNLGTTALNAALHLGTNYIDFTGGAQSESIRLANDTAIAWRNSANSSDIYAFIDGNDSFHITGALQITNVNGSNTNPAYSFASDTDTGMYRIGANSIGLATSGSLKLTVDTANTTSTLPYLAPDGSVSAPGYAFSSVSGTGMYPNGTTGIRFSTNGTERLRINGTNVEFTSMNEGTLYFGPSSNADTPYMGPSGANTNFFIVSPNASGLILMNPGAGSYTAYFASDKTVTKQKFVSETNESLASTANEVRLGGYDIAADRRTLAISTEEAVGGAPAAADASLIVRINGVNYQIHLTAV